MSHPSRVRCPACGSYRADDGTPCPVCAVLEDNWRWRGGEGDYADWRFLGGWDDVFRLGARRQAWAAAAKTVELARFMAKVGKTLW